MLHGGSIRKQRAAEGFGEGGLVEAVEQGTRADGLGQTRLELSDLSSYLANY